MESPVKYARSGDVHIAYRIFGDGPRDIVIIPGTVSHVELLWDLPYNAHFLRRLTAFARVIVFDKRGQGLSDRAPGISLEERVDDVRAVMDAANSQRATIYGWSEGGATCLMFAASYPERIDKLVLYGSYATQRHKSWPARAIRCAVAIRDKVSLLGLEIRVGLHTGECEILGDDIGGIAVHMAARVAACAGPGEITVSSTVKDLVAGSRLSFADRGRRTLRGLPGEWQILAVQ